MLHTALNHVWIFFNLQKKLKKNSRKNKGMMPSYLFACAGMMINGFVACQNQQQQQKQQLQQKRYWNLQTNLYTHCALVVAFKMQKKKEKKSWSFIGVIDKVAERNEKVKKGIFSYKHIHAQNCQMYNKRFHPYIHTYTIFKI